ncbi:MAG: type II CAAX endopeptidase family protein [Peptoniphilus sp.]|nr:type II CAAX endopeptidase family protein [Peptoniphilus sp.]
MLKNKYKKKNLNVLSVNTFTLVLAIIFLTIGYSIQSRDFFKGTFINEVFIILIPALLLSGSGKRTEVLKVKEFSFKNFIRVILVVIFSYPLILLLNGIFLTILSQFIALENFPMDYSHAKLKYLFYICLLPAICEEIFFRGALINSYKIYGGKFAILMSSLVFALFHFDVQNFIAPLLLGVLFGNLLELTGSIFAPMLAHFLNNVIAFLTARYVNETIFKYLNQTELARDIGSLQLYIIIVLGAISIVSVIVLRFLFVRMDREKRERDYLKGEHERTRYIQNIDFFNFMPILTLIILYFIYFVVVY